MRQFEVPEFYRSPIISRVKEARRDIDPRKKDLTPSILDFGPVRFKLARHFGFCYGVEHAIEIAFRALEENPGRRIFLLSEMIHNPRVNEDLIQRGIRFLRTTTGDQIVPFDDLTPEDVVIIPAFGSSIEVREELSRHGVDTLAYNTTCPFVERVWKRSEQIGKRNYTIVIHGKRTHEETRATFSHAKEQAPVVVIRNAKEAGELARIIKGELASSVFFEKFEGRYSEGFDPERDLKRIGVVNQTTMLATETQEIVEILKSAILERYKDDPPTDHFADTSDTLCYATNENQEATLALIADGGHLAIVVGGYNSSNTSHLVELCEESLATYFIRDAGSIMSMDTINHFDLDARLEKTTHGWLPAERPIDIVLSAGASCPDALLDEVIRKVVGWFGAEARPFEEVLAPFTVPSEA